SAPTSPSVSFISRFSGSDFGQQPTSPSMHHHHTRISLSSAYETSQHDMDESIGEHASPIRFVADEFTNRMDVENVSTMNDENVNTMNQSTLPDYQHKSMIDYTHHASELSRIR